MWSPIAAVLSFTANFGLPCSEALCLKREDIGIESDEPYILVAGDTPGNRKSDPASIQIRPRHIKWLKNLLNNGYKVQRRRNHRHGICDFEECFKIPKTGFIFRSRDGATADHLHYHAIYAHVSRQAQGFGVSPKEWKEVVEISKPVSHWWCFICFSCLGHQK